MIEVDGTTWRRVPQEGSIQTYLDILLSTPDLWQADADWVNRALRSGDGWQFWVGTTTRREVSVCVGFQHHETYLAEPIVHQIGITNKSIEECAPYVIAFMSRLGRVLGFRTWKATLHRLKGAPMAKHLDPVPKQELRRTEGVVQYRFSVGDG